MVDGLLLMVNGFNRLDVSRLINFRLRFRLHTFGYTVSMKVFSVREKTMVPRVRVMSMKRKL